MFSSSHPPRHTKFLSHQKKPVVRTLVTSTGSMRSPRTVQLIVMTPNTVTPEIAVLNSLKARETNPKNLASSILTSCGSGFFLPRIPPFRFHYKLSNISQATQHGLRNLAMYTSLPTICICLRDECFSSKETKPHGQA